MREADGEIPPDFPRSHIMDIRDLRANRTAETNNHPVSRGMGSCRGKEANSLIPLERKGICVPGQVLSRIEGGKFESQGYETLYEALAIVGGDPVGSEGAETTGLSSGTTLQEVFLACGSGGVTSGSEIRAG